MCKDPADSNCTVVVSVRDASFQTGLYYSVGVVDRCTGTTFWGPGVTGVIEYGNGKHPSVSLVAISNELFTIECHGSDFGSACYCCVGKVNISCKSIQWGDAESIGSGEKPKVSAFGKKFVVLMEQPCSINSLKYFVGTIVTNTLAIESIKEGTKITDFKGVEPDIAMTSNNIVAVYRSIKSYVINTILGTLDNDKGTITWLPDSKSTLNLTGKNPTISCNTEGNIVAVHQTWCCWNTLAMTCGGVTDNKITWEKGRKFISGVYPAIALSEDKDVFEMHSNPFGFSLFYSQGIFENPQGDN